MEMLDLQLKEGRFYSRERSDSMKVIFNEAGISAMNMKDPIGKTIDLGGPYKNLEIIGVVKDFHFESLKQNITPLAFFLHENSGAVTFRFEARNTQDVIQSIEKTWKSLAPGQPFQYSFLDEDFGRMYSSEQQLGKIFIVFASLAIIIACLGLFALTSFTAEQRTKEIGIRKVLGASVSSIVVLLSKEFGKLIVIAFVIAAPIAWFAVDWWLKNYTFKVEVGVFVYLIAGFLSFLIAWLTMSFQSFKAATNDPVKSLRSE
jgi:putative ABC transport system permease protein